MIRLLAALALLAGFSSHALADPACDAQFFAGARPVLMATALGDVELCATAFATLWSPATRDPIYSAERLTPAGLTSADKTARLDAFHADTRLPKGDRAEMSDYAGGDFDRGHMAPAHDMPTPNAMHESFVLSNMVPQDPANNRGVWAHLEEFTRRLVVLANEGFVVTGPIIGEHPRRMNGRVVIPDSLFKAVYVPANQFGPAQVGAYVVANTDDAKPTTISLNALKDLTGIDPFPTLSAEMHAKATLPPVATK